MTLLTAGVASGCGAERAGSITEDQVQARDSAGVTIVSSAAPAWGPGEGWRVSNESALQIGGTGPDSAAQLYRVQDGVRLSDGRVVVAERSAIRYFGPDGSFLRAVGGEGDGPGEYRALVEIRRLPGDSLLAFDLLRTRVTLLDDSGATARTISLEGDGRSRLPTNSVFRLADGRFLGAGGWSTGQVDDSAEPGLYRPNTAALRFTADGTLEDTVAVYPSADMAVMSLYAPPIPGAPPTRFQSTGLTLFSRIASTAIHDGELYLGTGESMEVRVHDAFAGLVRILRGPAPDLTITPEDVEAQQRARRGDSNDPDVEAYFDALFEAMPLPDTKPVFEDLFVDPSGNVWLAPFEGQLETDEPWMVFGADGRFLGPVALPPSIDVIDIDDEYVLAVWRDALDVEHVRLYAIERG